MPRGVLKSDLDGLDAECVKIAKQMIEGPETGPAAIANDSTLRAELEKSFGTKIPAGYTYFGQFVDHDITFDPASSLMRRNDPSGLRNFRTPRLDLDSVYGRGRDDQPYLYDTTDNRNKLLIGQVVASGFRDLPRNSQGRALIGDPRNDDNVIVSQLHLAFLLAHNALVARADKIRMADPFEEARRTLRCLYQYIVWNDFIKRVTIHEMHDRALKLVDAGIRKMKWTLGLEDIYSWEKTAVHAH